jgi:hypothetical protein
VAAGFGVRRGGAATRGKRRCDGLTGGGAGRNLAVRHAQTAETAAFRHVRSAGAPIARRRRGSDNGEVLSERHCRPAPLWRGTGAGAGAWQPRGNGMLTGGPDAERERLTGGTPRQ